MGAKDNRITSERTTHHHHATDTINRAENTLKKTGTIRKKDIHVTVLSAKERLKSPQQRNAENWWGAQLFGHRLSREVKIHHSRQEKPNAVFTRRKSLKKAAMAKAQKAKQAKQANKAN